MSDNCTIAAPSEARRIAISWRRRVVFAFCAGAVVVVGMVALLLAVDVYVHQRVQNLAAVNVWGYRGPTVPAKGAEEKRIVVLGGSTAFGYGLPYQEAFPFYLESFLNATVQRSHRYRVINLGAPGQGAYGFRFDLDDYAFLGYDLAILYEGYNDLGAIDLPRSVPPRWEPNYLLWRRQSPVFRLTGYFPVLPLVLREKAMALRSGGQLDAAYRGRVVFKPGLAARATAATLQSAAAIADALGTQFGRVYAESAQQPDSADKHSAEPVDTWAHYTKSVLTAVDAARRRGAKVLVVTQPYASRSHVAQQQAMADALSAARRSDPGVSYVNLGTVVDLNDPSQAYDGLHLVATANARIARRLVEPVLGMLQ